jgi:hypothetical protein
VVRNASGGARFSREKREATLTRHHKNFPWSGEASSRCHRRPVVGPGLIELVQRVPAALPLVSSGACHIGLGWRDHREERHHRVATEDAKTDLGPERKSKQTGRQTEEEQEMKIKIGRLKNGAHEEDKERERRRRRKLIRKRDEKEEQKNEGQR